MALGGPSKVKKSERKLGTPNYLVGECTLYIYIYTCPEIFGLKIIYPLRFQSCKAMKTSCGNLIEECVMRHCSFSISMNILREANMRVSFNFSPEFNFNPSSVHIIHNSR